MQEQLLSMVIQTLRLVRRGLSRWSRFLSICILPQSSGLRLRLVYWRQIAITGGAVLADFRLTLHGLYSGIYSWDGILAQQHSSGKMRNSPVWNRVIWRWWIIETSLLGCLVFGSLHHPCAKNNISSSSRCCSETDCKRGEIGHIKITFWGGPFDIQKLLSNSRTSGECWSEPEKFG